jgi:hypothetical protein
MCSNPRLNGGCAERVDPSPNLAHHGEIRLLGDPLEHPDPVIKRSRVPALWGEPVPHRHDDGVAELGHPPAEGVVGRGAAAPGDEPAAVELHDDGQPPTRGRSGVREVPPVRRGRGGRGGVAGAARVRRRGGEEDADGERGVGVDVEVLGRDAVGRGEGRVGGRGGLFGAAGDAERRGGRVGDGVGQRLEAVAEEELEEDAVDLHADARHGSRLTRIHASHGRILPRGSGKPRRRPDDRDKDRTGIGDGVVGGR